MRVDLCVDLAAVRALTFTAILPPGFMLDVGPAQIAIMLCSSGGAH